MPLWQALLIGYLAGSIPFGFLFAKAGGFGDIRNIGSGGIGATNVLRTGSKGLAAATVVLDALKGAAAMLLVWRLGDRDAALWAGFAALIGHSFPVWLGFRGGKSVATGYGVLFVAAWPVGIAAGAVWLIVARVGRISSLASLTSFAAAPIFAFVLADSAVATFTLATAVLIFIRHHENIRRLLAGTESRIGQKT